MKRFIKIFFISFLVLLALIIAAPFLFKDKIVSVIKEKTNEQLLAKVDFGNFDLSLFSSFPDFRFELEDLSIIGTGDFEKDTLARIEMIKLDLNLRSVISGGPYKINEITLKNPMIYARVLENGKANWDIVKPPADTLKSETPEDKKEASPFSLSLKKLSIENARIKYDDATSKMHALLDSLNFSLTGDFTQDDFDLTTALQIAKTSLILSGVPYLNKARIRFDAQTRAHMPSMKFTFKENSFYINDLGLTWSGFVAIPDSTMDMDLKLALLKADFKSILSLIPAIYTKDFSSLQTSGKIALDAFAKGTYATGRYPSFGLTLDIENAMFKYPSLPKSVNNIQLHLSVQNNDGKPDNTVIDLKQFHLEMAQNPVDMVARVTTPVSDPNIYSKVNGKIDLSSVKEFIPLEKSDELNGIIRADVEMNGRMSYVDKKEYEKFKAGGHFIIENMNYTSPSLTYPVSVQTLHLEFSQAFVALKKFDGLLGKSDVHASGRIDNLMGYVFREEALKGNFNFSSAFLDLNELMQSSGSSTSAPATTTSAPSPTAAPASTAVAEVPGNLDFELNSKIDKVVFQNMNITNVTGKITVRDKKAILNNLKMNMLQGSLALNGFYETPHSKKARTGLDLEVNHFDIQEAVRTFNTIEKLVPAAKYASGFFSTSLKNFVVDLNEKMEPDLASVNAEGTLKTSQIKVGGFPPLVKLSETLKMEGLKETQIQDVNVTYRIKDGRIYFDPFKTKISQVPVEISGSTGLDQTIDYLWKMEIPKSQMGAHAQQALSSLLAKANAAAGTNVQPGDKIKLNVRFGGTVTNPTLKTSVGEEVQNAVATVTTQVLNTAIDKAHEEAQKILDQAQEQVNKIRAETAAQIEKIRSEGYASADKLVEEAKNPLEKMAAKKAAEAAKKKVDDQCKKMQEESEARCNKIMEEAREKAKAKAEEAKK